MTEYNAGSLGMAKYWMDRAQRAEKKIEQEAWRACEWEKEADKMKHHAFRHKNRADQAEAECERLREGVKAVRDDIQAWGERAWNNSAAAQATRWTCDLDEAIASAPAVRDPIDILESNDWGLVPISAPTGDDDFDVQWTVVSYHMAEPKERVIGRGPTPRDALSDAVPF